MSCSFTKRHDLKKAGSERHPCGGRTSEKIESTRKVSGLKSLSQLLYLSYFWVIRLAGQCISVVHLIPTVVEGNLVTPLLQAEPIAYAEQSISRAHFRHFWPLDRFKAVQLGDGVY